MHWIFLYREKIYFYTVKSSRLFFRRAKVDLLKGGNEELCGHNYESSPLVAFRFFSRPRLPIRFEFAADSVIPEIRIARFVLLQRWIYILTKLDVARVIARAISDISTEHFRI